MCSSRAPERALLLALALGGGGAAARAEEAADTGAPLETITVWGEEEIARARARLERDLRAQGYRPGVRRGDRTVFRPAQAWKPTVVVYDDGFVVLRRTGVQLGVPPGVSPWWNLACPLAPPMCVRVGGLVVSRRKLDAQKRRVLEEAGPELAEWTGAIRTEAFRRRLEEELPEELDRLWNEGVPPEGEGRLETAAERRAALLELWGGRACTPEGDAVAEAVATFILEVVQTSDAPFPPGELEAARGRCGRRFPAP